MKHILLLSMAILIAIQGVAYASSGHSENFKTYLENENLKTLDDTPLFEMDVKEFYKARNYKPVWFKFNGRKLENINSVLNVIDKNAFKNGLEYADYNLENILDIQDSFEREWKFTNAIMHYMNDVQMGRINPANFDAMVFTTQRQKILSFQLEEFLETRRKEKFLNTLTPQLIEYKKLAEKLALYRKISSEGGWPKVNINNKGVIRPGESHPVILDVRKRLDAAYHEYDGQLPKDIWIDKAQLSKEAFQDNVFHQKIIQNEKDLILKNRNPDFFYDSNLAKKVSEFQYFHGKKADGVIGPQTVSVLNESIYSQIDKIKLSMERLRWLPQDLGEKHVLINIAAFYVRAVKNGRDEFVMPVVVGKVAHQTPVFSSVIYDVKMHPDWTSPDSIAERYVIPKIQKNPSSINRYGYQAISKRTGRVVPWSSISTANLSNRDYTFRQKPGKNNALGMARFSIKNDYAIFMHGTPAQSLFKEENRNFSSGCIRLEDPLKMAKFLLNDQGLSDAKIESLYNLEDGEAAKTNIIGLDEEVPVHITYMTAWIDQKGYLHFTDDAYGRDENLKKALTRLN